MKKLKKFFLPVVAALSFVLHRGVDKKYLLAPEEELKIR